MFSAGQYDPVLSQFAADTEIDPKRLQEFGRIVAEESLAHAASESGDRAQACPAGATASSPTAKTLLKNRFMRMHAI
jgi:hypothetical protein